MDWWSDTDVFLRLKGIGTIFTSPGIMGMVYIYIYTTYIYICIWWKWGMVPMALFYLHMPSNKMEIEHDITEKWCLIWWDVLRKS
jgi:hypothetical protein